MFSYTVLVYNTKCEVPCSHGTVDQLQAAVSRKDSHVLTFLHHSRGAAEMHRLFRAQATCTTLSKVERSEAKQLSTGPISTA